MTQYWNHHYFKFLLSGILAKLALLTELALVVGHGDRAIAQIIPDNSLGAEASVVTPNVEIKGRTAERIDGGAIRDSNLFHSFQDFNIGDLQRVYFANPAGITNIFSRVTGSNLSEILGTLGVNGSANLFLLNPNGIIFGENASLDVGGSFVASTADRVIFGNNLEFSATNPEAPPLLTINLPLGLQYGKMPGSIRMEGISGSQSRQLGLGLTVPPGKTLALVGGDITLQGAFLEAPGGRIDLGSVAEPGLVSLTPTNQGGWVLGYEGIQDFRNIQVLRSLVSTSIEEENELAVQGSDGAISLRASQLDIGRTSVVRTNTFTSLPGGDITIDVRNLTITDAAGVSAETFTEAPAGNLTVNASESVQLIGALDVLVSSLFTETKGTGDAGDLTINTKQLLIQDGAQISASTLGDGNAGKLTVNASELVQLIDPTPDSGPPSALLTNTGGRGNAGEMTINTRQLLVQNGSGIVAGTRSSGNGGNLTVNASESVRLIGTSADGRFPSGLSAQTQGTGNGGDVSITTGQFLVKDGAQVSTGTLGDGDGGTLTVNASESVQVIGATANSRSGLFASAIQGTGDGGDLTIVTDRLIVRDGATISASNFQSRNLLPPGSGAPGNLNISANFILLDNQGSFTAETAEGGEGNINLFSHDIRLLNNSNITANAQNTTGGNIFIDTDTLVAIDNSDITANAEEGSGGRVTINALGIFGTEFRDAENPETSDITATSNLGPSFSGEVILNTPEVDPFSRLVELPSDLVDVTGLINQNLCLAGQEGEFIITGKGGLSPSPQDTLNTDAGWEDWRMVVNSESNHQRSPQSSQTRSRPEANNHDSHQIVEAQSWFIAPNGNVVLSAQPVKSVSRSSSFLPPNCQLLDEVKQ